MPRAKRSFGGIRRLPSKRYQANYTGPDAQLHNAPHTFDTREDAEAWLAGVRRQISAGEWTPKGAKKRAILTFGSYAETWLERRTLKPRTRSHYRSLLDKHLLPTFGPMSLKAIDADDIGAWYAAMGNRTPTLRAHAYGLLRTILLGALHDRHIDHNPAHIRGAGTVKRARTIRPATLVELETITAEMPERLRLMVLLASWCALRYGELAELRRKDIDLTNGVVKVRRAVVRVDGQVIVTTPKSESSIRDVAIPPHLIPMVREHLSASIAGGRDGLLFPAADGISHLATSTLYTHFYKARAAAGRPDLSWHALRHTGATLAAATGATLAELMARLGHSTPGAALKYQHAAQGRDRAIADALSKLAESSSS